MRTLTLCLLLALFSVPAHADEVHLKNGDRITGVTASLADGTLVFKATGGDLKLAWTDVTSLSIDTPMLVTVGTAAPVAATFAGADASDLVTLVPGGPTTLSSIVALSLPAPAWTFAGGASAGIVNTSGNSDVKSLRISGDFSTKGVADRYSLSGIATHADDSGVERARNWTTTGKYDRFLTRRMFANATADFTNDRFRDIDLRTAVGVGLGYQLIETARTSLTTDVGAAWVNENFRTIADDSYSAAHEAVDLQLQVLPDRVKIFHIHNGYFGAGGENKMFIRMQNGIRIGLAAGFVTTIEHDVDYDRVPSPGRRQTDRTFSLTLGYRF